MSEVVDFFLFSLSGSRVLSEIKLTRVCRAISHFSAICKQSISQVNKEIHQLKNRNTYLIELSELGTVF